MLESFSQSEAWREGVLFSLLRHDLNDHVEEMLREFVKSGTREEAVAATRALCGYKVVSLYDIKDQDQRSRIAQTGDRAKGRLWYWVRREEFPYL